MKIVAQVWVTVAPYRFEALSEFVVSVARLERFREMATSFGMTESDLFESYDDGYISFRARLTDAILYDFMNSLVWGSSIKGAVVDVCDDTTAREMMEMWGEDGGIVLGDIEDLDETA